MKMLDRKVIKAYETRAAFHTLCAIQWQEISVKQAKKHKAIARKDRLYAMSIRKSYEKKPAKKKIKKAS